MATLIHPTAIVESGAQLGVDCEIHAYALINRHVQLGDRCVVSAHAVLGGDPQYLKFDRALSTYVRIGAGTVIRESVTINRSIRAEGATTVGNNCFIMAGAHIGHDCALGDNVVLANNVLLAGHVTIGDYAFLGGMAGIHQFARIGNSAMVGGGGRISRDIPPYLLVTERDHVSGLNLVGLKRRNVSREAILELKNVYQTVFSAVGNIRENCAKALLVGNYRTEEARNFLGFFSEGKRGFVRPSRAGAMNLDDES